MRNFNTIMIMTRGVAALFNLKINLNSWGYFFAYFIDSNKKESMGKLYLAKNNFRENLDEFDSDED